MNNLQIAIARIYAGLTWVLGLIKDLFNGNLANCWHINKQTRVTMKCHGTNHVECNVTVGKISTYAEKFVNSEKEDSYMTNASLNICVPIAPEESDMEFSEEEESGTETSEDEVNKPVSWLLLIICRYLSTLIVMYARKV